MFPRLLVILFLIGLPVGLLQAQSGMVNVTDRVTVTTSGETTSLDRVTRELVTSALIRIQNTSTEPIRSPIHAVFNFDDPRVGMPGMLGGPGVPPYQTYFRVLGPQFGADTVFDPGETTFLQAVFRRPAGAGLRYQVVVLGVLDDVPHYERNPPSVVVTPAEVTVYQGQQASAQVTAWDPDGTPVSLSAAPGLRNARFSATPGPVAFGSFGFAPDFDQAGVYQVVFEARDPDGMTGTAALGITVLRVNRPPTLEVPSAVAGVEGVPLAIPLTASDPDGDPLIFDVAPLPANAVFLPSTQAITFSPDFGQAGVYDVECQVSDGVLSSPRRNVRITIAAAPLEGPGARRELELEVAPIEEVNLLARQTVRGTVNVGAGPPPPVGRQAALIEGLDPASAEQGATLNVLLSGATGFFAPSFAPGVSRADFGPSIRVNSLTVTAPNRAVANITIPPEAPPEVTPVQVRTAGETAVSVPAFRILRGSTRIRGILVDPDTGLPLAGARVTLEGTGLTATTGADGSFALHGAPPGVRTLIVNAANHQLLRIEVEGKLGTDVDLGRLESPATVFDPSAPPSVSLISILGRGLTELGGRLTHDQARRLILDTLLLLGGDEIGALDEFGNQLNPNVSGEGLMSLAHNGIQVYADRLVKGENVPLGEVLADLSFGFRWPGAPPRLIDWLNFLQAGVNAAWADPQNPDSQLLILLFNRGAHLTPEPPVLAANTRLNRFQAYLAVNSFMTELFKRGAVAPASGSPVKGGRAGPAVERQSAGSGPYTVVWNDFLNGLGVAPAGGSISSAEDLDPSLFDFEQVLKRYYLDHSEDARDELKALLLGEFPGIGIEDIFQESPLDVRTAVDRLLDEIKARNLLVQERILHWDLRATLDFQKGNAHFSYFTHHTLPINELNVRIVSASWAPTPPRPLFAEETAVPLGELSLPGVRVYFQPSGDDRGAAGEAFYYRLWRIARPEEKTYTNLFGQTATRQSDLILVGFGRLDETGNPRAPKKDPAAAERAFFELLLPPPGMNSYRLDCVRVEGEGTVVGSLTAADLGRVEPWFGGYLDRPLAKPPYTGLGRSLLHTGHGFMGDFRFDASPLSHSVAAYIAGTSVGIAALGRVDLAADRLDGRKTYLSIAGFKISDDPHERGSGSIFRYDPYAATLTEHVRPGFIRPGQVGLAIDSNFNLYTDNAASDGNFGGRVFRLLGWRAPEDGDYRPPFPNPSFGNPAAAAAGDPPARLFVGSMNYYSRMLQLARPTSVQQIVMGGEGPEGFGEELYAAETLTHRIKRIPVRQSELRNFDPFHSVGQDWAWNDINTLLPAWDQLRFDGLTDLAFDPTLTTLFATQGPYVVRTSGGEDGSRSITGEGQLFRSAAGCAVCVAPEGDYLFVSDHGDGSRDPVTGGKIYRIPLSDLPLTVPADPSDLRERYVFLRGLDRPGQVRITERNQAMVFADQTGLNYLNFGFSGRLLDSDDLPYVGAVVTVSTAAGTRSTVTDSEGRYTFDFGGPVGGDVIIHVTHPDAAFSEKVTGFRACGTGTKPVPCVVVNSPAHEARTSAPTVVVEGAIYPASFDFSQSGGFLRVSNGGGETSYPLQFTGTDNHWRVTGVSLAAGDNVLRAVSYPLGVYESGQSNPVRVHRAAAPAATQAVAGTITDADGIPRGGVTVRILVDGVEVAEVTTDACGYFSASGLPPGAVSVETDD